MRPFAVKPAGMGEGRQDGWRAWGLGRVVGEEGKEPQVRKGGRHKTRQPPGCPLSLAPSFRGTVPCACNKKVWQVGW